MEVPAELTVHSGIDTLIANLSRRSDHLREEAAFELRHADGIKVVEALIKALKDPIIRVRSTAADSLAFMDFAFKDQIVDGLLHLLDDDSDTVKLAAAKSLGRMWNEKALDKMITLLDSENRHLRIYASLALGRTRNVKAMGALARLLLKEKDKKARSAILMALGHAGNKKVVPLLIKSGLGDQDRRVRASAVEALGLFDYSDKERFQIIEIIRKTIASDDDNRVLGNAIITLHRLGDFEALVNLPRMIKSSNKWDRASAAYVCGIIGNIETADALLSLVRDQDTDVRLNVVRAMGRIANSRFIDYLVGFLDDTDDTIKREAFQVFQQIDNPKATHPANRLLYNRNDVIRYLAACVIRNVRDSSSLPPVVDALIKEKNPEVKEFLERLLQLLVDRHPLALREVFTDSRPREAHQLALDFTRHFPEENRRLVLEKALKSKYRPIKEGAAALLEGLNSNSQPG